MTTDYRQLLESAYHELRRMRERRYEAGPPSSAPRLRSRSRRSGPPALDASPLLAAVLALLPHLGVVDWLIGLAFLLLLDWTTGDVARKLGEIEVRS